MNMILEDTRIAGAALALVRRVTGSFPDRIDSVQLAAARFATRYSVEQLDRLRAKFVVLDPRPSATLVLLSTARYYAQVARNLDERDAELARLNRAVQP